MKWRLAQTSPANRWYPVMLRYISYIAGRIDGLGGDSGSIKPSPYGSTPSGSCAEERNECSGRICALTYDRCGELTAFRLRTEDKRERDFHGVECEELEELLRFAWEDQLKITVVFGAARPHCPVSVVLHRPASWFRRFLRGFP
jgi:hypothetical protein